MSYDKVLRFLAGLGMTAQRLSRFQLTKSEHLRPALEHLQWYESVVGLGDHEGTWLRATG